MADNLIDYLPYKTICIEFGLICELPEIATLMYTLRGTIQVRPSKRSTNPQKI